MTVMKNFVLLGALIGALASAQTASAQSETGAAMRDANSAARSAPHNPPDYRTMHNPPGDRTMHNPPGFRTGGVPPDPYAAPSTPSGVPPDPYKCLLADAFAKLMGQKSSCQ
ncbi:MAG: hypothetical protein V4857_02105 [Pseudomonadota bacterium]